MYSKPILRPTCSSFGSGPTKKYPGWHIEHLSNALVGRSHRSIQGKERLCQIIDLTRSILGIPTDYKIAILSGSATCAVECALWSLLGERNVDVISFDVFGRLWLDDILTELKLKGTGSISADFGDLPNLKDYNSDNDLVFTWNGTTSGVCIPNGDWIPSNRRGLTICDATSAAFCVDLPWDKLDVTAYSWQKGLGGEAGHGMIILSPKAVERLESYRPDRPIPRLFRLVKDGKLIDGIFRGETINTPSLLCVEDCFQALEWAKSIGGLPALMTRCQENFTTLKSWVDQRPWIDFMATSQAIRSMTSVCLVLSVLKGKNEQSQRDFLQSMATLLRQQEVGFDFVNHAYSPPSLRVWCGPTIEKTDLEAFLPWLDWAYHSLHELLRDLP